MDCVRSSVLLTLAAAVTAQVPVEQTLDRVVVPIHTAPGDPDGGAYGTWGGAESYKASFHDGFTFVPYLGVDYPQTRTWSWRTTSMTVGGQEATFVIRPAHRRADYRYEYDHGAFVEAYDVRAGGVEQSFVVADRPLGRGDLVVEGRVSTSLHAGAVGTAHRALTFIDDAGRAIMRYGEAIAFDAAGSRTEVLTTWEAGRLRLTVPGAWLDEARYPVTIDPVISRTLATTGQDPTRTMVSTDIARDDFFNELMIAVVRAASSTDIDTFAYTYDDDFTFRGIAFSDMTTSWSTRDASVAFVASTRRWVLAFGRVFSNNSAAVRFALHPARTTTTTTTVYPMSKPTGSHDLFPDVGGTRTLSATGANTNAMIVFQRDVAPVAVNTGDSDIYYAIIDTENPAPATPQKMLLTRASGEDRDFPRINQSSRDATDGWMVVFQESDPFEGRSWDTFGFRFDGTGTQMGGAYVTGFRSTANLNQLRPVVAGSDSRYLVAFVTWTQAGKTSFVTGDEIWAEGMNWSPSQPLPNKHGTCLVTRTSQRALKVSSLAFDHSNRTFWALGFNNTATTAGHVARLGYDGALERAIQLPKQPANTVHSVAVTFDDDNGLFPLCYATDEASPNPQPVYGAKFTYPPESIANYGFRCGPGRIDHSGIGLRGSQFFGVTLAEVAPSAPAALLIGLGASNAPLDRIGMPGCRLNVSPIVVTASRIASSTGRATVVVPLSCALQNGAKLYFQWAYLAQGANALGVGATQGLRLDL